MSNTLKILKKLIAFDTTIAKDTLEAVEYVADFLKKNDIKPQLVYNHDQKRASLLATIGDPKQAGLILSGHLDTVAVEKDCWKYPSHCLTEDNNCYFGRGTTDMKGAIACVLGNIETLKNSGKTFHLVLTHDEEGRFSAINQLIDSDFNNFFKTKPYACIVMEPTLLSPVGAHKGAFAYNINIKGKEAHSASPHLADDALKHGVDIYNQINEAFDKYKPNFVEDEDFTPNHTTLSVCQFTSGDAINKISGHAFFSFVVRSIPEDDLSGFKQYVTDICRDKRINLKPVFDIPSFQTDDDSKFIKSFGEYKKVSYCTEAGFFQNHGIPTIIYGPGDITQAHTIDEFIEKQQLEKFEEFIRGL